MRALPGRASRTSLAEPAAVTRERIDEGQQRRILQATGELVAKRGYADVSVELIIKRARVSFKTFYGHYPNKQTCFLALFDLVAGRCQDEIDAALALAAEAPWPEQVLAAVGALFDVILADPLLARACIVEAPTVGPVVSERYERFMKSLSPLLAGGREFGNLDTTQLPATLEDTLAGGVLWSAYQRLSLGEVDRISALMPEAIEFVLRPYLGQSEAARWARGASEPLLAARTPL